MKRWPLLLGAGVAAAGLAAWAFFAYFAPEPSTVANEPLPDLGNGTGTGLGAGTGKTSMATSQAPPTSLRSGAFTGADGFHYARGSVALHQAANGTYLLRFEDYDAREGPDVYLYLTRRAGDSSRQSVEGEGIRLRVPGGAEDGRATVRGDFNLYLPEGTDPLAYGGVTIWCDAFDQFFGHAPLA